MGTPDIRHTDALGNVVHDSRLERIERRRSLAKLAARAAGDPVVDSILRGYSAAVNDPGNELVHLYEIRDALKRAGELGGRGDPGCTTAFLPEAVDL
jgi:hypothetical protein